MKIKYPSDKAILNCDECGKRAEVLGVFGECEVPLCASCYVRSVLPKTDIEMTGKDGVCYFDGATVGNYYVIGKYSYPDPVPTEVEVPAKIRQWVERMELIGVEEISGKRCKNYNVILKDGYSFYKGCDKKSRYMWNAQLQRMMWNFGKYVWEV